MRKARLVTIIALLIVGIVVAGAGWFMYFLNHSGPDASHVQPQVTPDEHAGHDEAGAVSEKAETTIWTCSMHPQIRLPEPGQCPICFMDLVPVKTDAAAKGGPASLRRVGLSPEARALAKVTLAPVEWRSVVVTTRLLGKVSYDETRLASITAWMSGRIDKLYVDFTGVAVEKGQPMAEIYSPDLLTAQAELLQARKAMAELRDSSLELVKDAAQRTERAAREKLRLLGIPAAQIERLARSVKPADHMTLLAPAGGVVVEKNVLEGQYVQTGTRVYTIADLSVVWIMLEAYENDLPWIEAGREVVFEVVALPGRRFTGQVVFIDPRVDEKTRTVGVRLEADNSEGRLKPGMFVRAVQAARPEQGEVLTIPATAPLITGKRAVVYVAQPDSEGLYEGREIVLGPRAGDFYVVKSGLEAGDLVVTKGNFKIDSAAQIMAKPTMMNPDAGQPAVGHQHGPVQAATDQGDAAQADTQQLAADLPDELLQQLQPLAQDFAALEDAVETASLEAAKTAFQNFYDTLSAVDPPNLVDDNAALWRELSMLLKNDARIGADALTLQETRWHFQELAQDYMRLEAHFPAAMAKREQVFHAPIQFREQLGRLFSTYLELHRHLALDDAQAARQTLAPLTSALAGVDMALLPGEPHMAWMRMLTALQSALETMTQAKDLAALRVGFASFSQALLEALRMFGQQSGREAYELYCPMAFQNTGGTWLQDEPEVNNPYVPSMSECGEVKGKIDTGGH